VLNRNLIIGAVLAALAIGANEARAQGIQIRPWAGLYAPTAELGSVQAIDFGKKKSTLAYGLDLDLGGGPIAFRLGGGYAGNSDIPIAGVGCTNCAARATVLVGTGAIVIRPLPIPVVQPYAVAGVGAKWYNFDFDNAALDGLISDQAKFTAQLGAGAVLFPGGSLSVFGEVSDYMSGFKFKSGGSSNTQHDLVLKLGLVLGSGR
jgi:hypothetical protein